MTIDFMADNCNTTQPLSLLSCPSTGATAKASSILNKNKALYGPQNALDINDTCSCWNSDGDQAQHQHTGKKKPKQLLINFNRLVNLDGSDACIKIVFQGGFVGLGCATSISCDDGQSYQDLDIINITSGENDSDYRRVIEADDCNDVQTFLFQGRSDSNVDRRGCTHLKLAFHGSTDFYGRITIYRLEIWGHEVVNG